MVQCSLLTYCTGYNMLSVLIDICLNYYESFCHKTVIYYHLQAKLMYLILDCCNTHSKCGVSCHICIALEIPSLPMIVSLSEDFEQTLN
jgi:hypothetical protein